MNFLAHALLAGASPADRAGGILGDFIKGRLEPAPPALAPALVAGLVLHRRIDCFADQHPAFCRSRARISVGRRRVSGIMVDLFYDHFLALHWARFSSEPLPIFAETTYQDVAHYGAPLPASFIRPFKLMVTENWLVGYQEAHRTIQALERIAQFRLRWPNPLRGAGEELLHDYEGFEADFFEFLPDALAFAADVRVGRAALAAV